MMLAADLVKSRIAVDAAGHRLDAALSAKTADFAEIECAVDDVNSALRQASSLLSSLNCWPSSFEGE